jgi:hypothetical protein
LVNEAVVHKTMIFGYQTTFFLLDKGLIETANPTGLSYTFDVMKKNIASLHSGSISDYLLIPISFFVVGALFTPWKCFLSTSLFLLLISYGLLHFSTSIWV